MRSREPNPEGEMLAFACVLAVVLLLILLTGLAGWMTANA